MPGTMNLPNINFGGSGGDITKLTGGWLPGQDIQQQFVDAFRQLYGGFQPGLNPAQQNGLGNAQGAIAGINPALGVNNINAALAGGGRVPGGAWADPSMGGWRDLAAGAAGPQGLDYLTRAAGGEFVGDNPWLTKTFDMAADPVARQFQSSIMPSIEGRASMAGRVGSGSEANLYGDAQRTMGDTLDRLATSIYGGAYEGDMSRMHSAGLALPGAYATDQQRQAAALGGLSDAAARQIGVRQQAATGSVNNLLNLYGGLGNMTSGLSAPGRMQYDLATLEQMAPLTQWQQFAGAYNSEFGRPSGLGGYSGVAPYLGAGASTSGTDWAGIGAGALGLGASLGGAYLGGPGGAAFGSWLFGQPGAA